MHGLTTYDKELEQALGDRAALTAVNTPREVGELLLYEVRAAIRAAARAGVQIFRTQGGDITVSYDKAYAAALKAIHHPALLGDEVNSDLQVESE